MIGFAYLQTMDALLPILLIGLAVYFTARTVKRRLKIC